MRAGALAAGRRAAAGARARRRARAWPPATVAAAYKGLRQRGLVETAGRNGTRVRAAAAGRAPGAARRCRAPPGTVDLSTGRA